MVRRLPARAAAALIAVAALTATLASCASSGGAAPSSSGSAAALDTVTAGKLTIATGQPAYSPWVLDDDPASGKGFEAAVAYAVAEELGFGKGDVVWTRTTFDSAIAPGPKDWDLNLQQFSITDERKKAVDFSSPYYTTSQAVVTLKGSAAADATTIAKLKDVTVGVASSTTSYTIAAKELGTAKLSVFNSNDDAVLALKSKQVDAIVVDLPTAFYLASAELDDGVVLGQFADTTGGDQFGIVLPKGSPLTSAVSGAVDALRKKGTLDKLVTTWLSKTTNVPILG